MGTVFIVILMVLILAGIGLVSLFRRRNYLLRLALIEHRACNDVLSRAHMIDPGLARMFHGLTFVVPS